MSALAIILVGCSSVGTTGVNSTNVNKFVDNQSGLYDCKIKGNIKYESDEKIYHIPGQKYYNNTKINTKFGERWFCTEQETRSVGWRKSKI